MRSRPGRLPGAGGGEPCFRRGRGSASPRSRGAGAQEGQAQRERAAPPRRATPARCRPGGPRRGRGRWPARGRRCAPRATGRRGRSGRRRRAGHVRRGCPRRCRGRPSSRPGRRGRRPPPRCRRRACGAWALSSRIRRICSTRAGSTSTITGPRGRRHRERLRPSRRGQGHARRGDDLGRGRPGRPPGGRGAGRPASRRASCSCSSTRRSRRAGLLGHRRRNSRRWRSLTPSPSSSSRKPLSAAIGVFSSCETLATRSRRARSSRRCSVTSRRVMTVPRVVGRRRGARRAARARSRPGRTTWRRSAGGVRGRGRRGTASRIAGGRASRRADSPSSGSPSRRFAASLATDDGAVGGDRDHALGQRPDHRPVAVALARDLGDQRPGAGRPSR